MARSGGSRPEGFLLLHRRRPLAPMIGKVLLGLAGFGGALVLIVLLEFGAETRPAAVRLIGSGVAVLAFLGGFWIGQDGVTDLIARWHLRSVPRRALRLDADGLHYTPDFGSEPIVSVPWSDVEGCALRPGFGNNVFLCFDAPGHHPQPPMSGGAPAHGGPGVDPEIVRRRAYLWSLTVRPEPAPLLERLMLIDTYVFGTPIAVNLAVCGPVNRAALDAALRDWTRGRCGLPAAGLG